MSYVDCDKHAADLAKKQDQLADCSGVPLTGLTQVATCDQLAQSVEDALANALKDCDGAAITPGTQLVTCADLATKLQLTINGHQLTIAGGNTVTLPDNDNQTLSINGNVITISGGNSITIPPEVVTTLVKQGTGYLHTNELGVQTVIAAATFVSTDAGNSIAVGSDGGLKVLIPAQLPDDQILTADSSGTVSLTLTPVTNPDGTINYTVKADLKVAANTPSGGTNTLVWSPSGYYVAEATDTTKGVVALNNGTNLPADTTNCTDALTACGFEAMASQVNTNLPNCGNAIQTAIVDAITQTIACDPVALQTVSCAIANDSTAMQCLLDKLVVPPTTGKYYFFAAGNMGDGTSFFYKADNGVVSQISTDSELSQSGKPVSFVFNQNVPTAYGSPPGIDCPDANLIVQCRVTDAGVTRTYFDVSTVTSGIDASGVRLVRYMITRGNALYMVFGKGTASRYLIKFNLDPITGLILNSAWEIQLASISQMGENLQDVQANVVMTSEGFYNATTGAVIYTAPLGDLFGIALSPDGTKYVKMNLTGSGPQHNYAEICNVADQSVISTSATLYNNYGLKNPFFSPDSTKLICGLQLPIGIAGIGAPWTAYDVNTFAEIGGNLLIRPNIGAGGAAAAGDTAHVTCPDNGAIALVQNSTMSILEYKNGLYTEVAFYGPRIFSISFCIHHVH